MGRVGSHFAGGTDLAFLQAGLHQFFQQQGRLVMLAEPLTKLAQDRGIKADVGQFQTIG
jgi:hypothetical protein